MNAEVIGEPHRPQWKTRAGFLLAAMGSAIGLGNIWRFPYLCYENGGGAFLIPYFVALFTAGIPLMILEYGIGQRMRGSAPLSFAKVSRRWEWLGWWAVVFVMFGIVLYYSVIISWCLNYLFFSFNLSWRPNPDSFFFQNFLGRTQGPEVIGDVRSPILFGLVVIWFLNWLIVFSGVERGIERANKIFIPILFLLVCILAAWGFSLPGAKVGILHYLKPDFSVLSNPKVWMDAYSQIFFTLSLGFGIMVAYASYLPRKSDIAENAFITSLSNCGFSIIAGFAVFGTLGYMASQLGKPLGEVVQQSIGLAFVAYPKAIGLLPGFSRLFGVLFFGALVVAGISSSISIMEAFSSALIDKFHYSRRIVVTVLSIAGLLGAIIFATGGGIFWLDIVDHFLSHYGLVVVGILECILVGWLFKASRLRTYLNHISRLKLHAWWDFCVKMVTPVVLGVMLLSDLIKEISSPYNNYPWLAIVLIGRDWLLITLVAALFISSHPWRVAPEDKLEEPQMKPQLSERKRS